jgi:hypothetical protein
LYVRKQQIILVLRIHRQQQLSMVPPPAVPTASSVAQPPTCVANRSIVIVTQSGIEYSVNGTTYQASNSFTGLAPGTIHFMSENSADNTCVTSSSSSYYDYYGNCPCCSNNFDVTSLRVLFQQEVSL